MNKNVDLLKKVNIEKLVKEGDKVYETVKSRYESKYNGWYLAIEPESGKVFLGKTGDVATRKAEKAHPEKVFYLVKIGFTSVETIARSYLQ
jgi:hypothetical protein